MRYLWDPPIWSRSSFQAFTITRSAKELNSFFIRLRKELGDTNINWKPDRFGNNQAASCDFHHMSEGSKMISDFFIRNILWNQGIRSISWRSFYSFFFENVLNEKNTLTTHHQLSLLCWEQWNLWIGEALEKWNVKKRNCWGMVIIPKSIKVLDSTEIFDEGAITGTTWKDWSYVSNENNSDCTDCDCQREVKMSQKRRNGMKSQL